jgi:hypothetical protein
MLFRRVAISIAFTAVFSIAVSSTPAIAATPKVGTSCTKVGAKSGSLICAKVAGKLKWTVAKKAQSIFFTATTQTSVDEKSVPFSTRSTSKLVVTAKSLSPDICTLAVGLIELSGAPGTCTIQLNQGGNATFLAAPAVSFNIKVMGINSIDFALPGALLLTQSTFEMSATGASSAPVVFASQTSSICEVSGSTLLLKSIGKCIVSANQSADDNFPAAKELLRTLEISSDRVTADLPDAVSGFQIKAIYVVPSDGTDHAYDTNGTLKSVLDDGLSYLKDQLGLQIPIDSTATGYDIGFMKSTKSSQYFLTTSGSYAELLKESAVLNAPGSNRKNYIFFVDTDTIIDSGYCGEAPRPGMVAVVAIGLAECGKQTNHFSNYASQTWVHEIFHNFGVGHVADSCDVMTGGQTTDGPTCPVGELHTIDVKRNMYVGADIYGADISRLRVWTGYTSDMNLLADCIVTPTNAPGPNGYQFSYCPTGTQTIGPASFCWTNVDSVSLEQLVNGTWVSLGAGQASVQPWGTRVDWKCGTAGYSAPSIQLTVNSPGTVRYRWLINGRVGEEMEIVWVA